MVSQSSAWRKLFQYNQFRMLRCPLRGHNMDHLSSAYCQLPVGLSSGQLTPYEITPHGTASCETTSYGTTYSRLVGKQDTGAP
jgi:hypothetical protein